MLDLENQLARSQMNRLAFVLFRPYQFFRTKIDSKRPDLLHTKLHNQRAQFLLKSK